MMAVGGALLRSIREILLHRLGRAVRLSAMPSICIQVRNFVRTS